MVSIPEEPEAAAAATEGDKQVTAALKGAQNLHWSESEDILLEKFL